MTNNEILELAYKWKVSPLSSKVHFVFAFTRLVWKYASWKKRSEFVIRYFSYVLPAAVATLLIATNLTNPVALIAASCAFVLCVADL